MSNTIVTLCAYCAQPLHYSAPAGMMPLLVGPDGQTYCAAAPGIAGAHTHPAVRYA